MATKKAKKQVKKAAPAKRAGTSAAAKYLAELPAIDAKVRAAYRGAFSDAQCDAWGSKTKAASVLAEGERLSGELRAALKKGPVLAYSPRRLAWLCTQLVELDDAVAAQATDGAAEARAGRSAAVTVANQARRTLAAQLLAVAGGDAALRKEIAARNETSPTPHVVEASLTGLVELAQRLRRTPATEVLCDDAGLDADALARAMAAVEQLDESNQRTYGQATDQDTPETNRVEGRVLREMAFAYQCFRRARDVGQAVPALKPGAALRAVLQLDGEANDAPTKPSA